MTSSTGMVWSTGPRDDNKSLNLWLIYGRGRNRIPISLTDILDQKTDHCAKFVLAKFEPLDQI